MFNDEDFIEELRFCLRTKDVIKIKVLLNEMGNVSTKVGQRLLFEISRSEESLSIPLLLFIQTHHPGIALTMPTLNDVLYGKMHTLTDCESLYSSLESVEAKCCFIEALSETDSKEINDFLIQLIRVESKVEIIRSILRTMAEIKSSDFADVVTDYLYSDDFKLVLQAIETLGRCVSSTGVKALASRAGSDMSLDKKIVNALARIANDDAIAALVNFLASNTAHLRNYSRVALVNLKERSVDALVKVLGYGNKAFTIIALNTLGETGALEAVKPIRRFLQNYPEDPNIRFSAYEALGLLPVKAGAYTLTDGLSDEVESVRMAAAKAVDHLFDNMFEMGVKNILSSHENPEQIVEAFLIAECNNVFKTLMFEDVFCDLTVAYFTENHSPELLKHYAQLDPTGELVRIEKLKSVEESSSEFQVCVVDDSRLLLRIYRKMLDQLEVSCHLFEFAEAALEHMQENKPSLLITDLNMPGMDGIELTRKVRSIYDASELPIAMVTTQDENSDGEEARMAGVQYYMNKPFTVEMLKDLIDKSKEN